MKINQVIEGLKDPKDNPCWKGYKPVGTKKKGGRTVPNCVPKESVAESKKCPQCGSTNCTCPPGKCNCKPVEGWIPKESVSEGAQKKPNATTRHLRDYPVSDKDVAKPVKKPEKKKPEQGVAEGEKKPHPKTWHDVDPKLGKQVDKMSQAEKVKKGYAHPDTLKKKGVAEGSEEGKTQKYEMMLSNGKVKRFTAKDDADAKRIAKGHGAKSVIKMKGDVPGNKIAEQGVAEGSPQSLGTALRNTLSRVEPGSKLDKKIRHHNDMVRRFGPEAGIMTSAPDGYHIDKKGFVRLGQGVAEDSDYMTDNMVSHITQIITHLDQQGGGSGDRNTFMKLVARKMPRIVQDNPKLFRRAFGIAYDRYFHIDQDDDDFDYTDYSMRKGERGVAESLLSEEEYDYYRDYKAGLISYDEYQKLVQQFQNRERDQQNRQRDNDRGPWYIKVNGKILKSRGEVKVFDWKRGANNYALAILKNKPELQGKILLTKKAQDDEQGVAEGKNTVKVPVKQKPRQGPLRPQTGAGAHKDKKKDQKQGKEKHKKPVYEGFNSDLEMQLHQLARNGDFDEVYDAMTRNDELGKHLSDMYNDIAIDFRLHPDDDFESIIDILQNRLEQEFGDPDLDEDGTLKVAKDDDNMTVLQNPATGVQTQIDKKNPNAPRLTQDETGKLKLSVPQGAQTGQQGQEKKPNLIGKDVAVDSSPVEAVHRISASPSQPGGEITDVNTKSTISGDEEHDEISKLLNQRLRKLAGL